jgi:uncharacterized membrane protein
MNKQEFLTRLREGLAGLPREDAEERLAFYEEMIDDRVEDGLSEAEAVAEIGPVETVVQQIVADTPLPKLVKERIRSNRRLQGWELVLLVLGFPLWLPLLIAAAVVIFAVYVVIWAVVLSLWAVELALAVSALGCLAGSVVLFCRGDGTRALLGIAGALVLAGLSIFGFYSCKAVTKGAARLTGKIALGIKSLFLRKENAK